MKKFFVAKLIGTMSLLCATNITFAESTTYSDLRLSSWGNGYDLLSYDKNNSTDTDLAFIYGTLHEGGGKATIKNLKNKSKKVTGGHITIEGLNYDNLSANITNFKVDDNSYNALVIKEDNGKLFDLYLPLVYSETNILTNLELLNQSTVIEPLMGTYEDEHGYQVTFKYETVTDNAEENCTYFYGCGTRYVIETKEENGFVNSIPVTFYNEYDFAVPFFTFPDQKLMHIAMTEQGIDLYNASLNEDEMIYEKKDKVKSLKFTDKNNRRFGIFSKRPVSKAQLYSYPVEVLRLIRNEIFAVHGYKFSNKKLKEYFSNTNWYKQKEEMEPLNEIEKMNIVFIKHAESLNAQ